MVALTLWLVGLALLLRPAAERAMGHRRVRRLVQRAHGLLLTVFLWHVTAIALGAGVARAVGAPEPAIGSGRWWALRPAWLVWLLPFMALLAWVFGRLEAHPAGRPIADQIE